MGPSAVKSDRGSESKLRNCLLGRGDVSPIIKILEYISISFFFISKLLRHLETE